MPSCFRILPSCPSPSHPVDDITAWSGQVLEVTMAALRLRSAPLPTEAEAAQPCSVKHPLPDTFLPLLLVPNVFLIQATLLRALPLAVCFAGQGHLFVGGMWSAGANIQPELHSSPTLCGLPGLVSALSKVHLPDSNLGFFVEALASPPKCCQSPTIHLPSMPFSRNRIYCLQRHLGGSVGKASDS